MAEATAIAKLLIPANTIRQPATGGESPKKSSGNSPIPADGTNTHSADTSKGQNSKIEKINPEHPFARLLSNRLEKNEKKENKKKEKPTSSANPAALTGPNAENNPQKSNPILKLPKPKEAAASAKLLKNSTPSHTMAAKPNSHTIAADPNLNIERTRPKDAPTKASAGSSEKIQLFPQKAAGGQEKHPAPIKTHPAGPESVKTGHKPALDTAASQKPADKPTAKTDQAPISTPEASKEVRLTQPESKTGSTTDSPTDPAGQNQPLRRLQPVRKNRSEIPMTEANPSKKITSLDDVKPGNQPENSEENTKKGILSEQKELDATKTTPYTITKESVQQNQTGHSDSFRSAYSVEQDSSGTPGTVRGKAPAAPRPVVQTTTPDSATLSPAQQVLRGIQTDFNNNEVRRVDIALNPAGLGMVRIRFQRQGEDISGVLEVQKPETRREIEKSMPQILSSLENQGIHIRKIEFASMPNSNQRQSGFDGTGDWTLNREMAQQEHNRNTSASTSTLHEPKADSAQEFISRPKKNRYESSVELENLNLFA